MAPVKARSLGGRQHAIHHVACGLAAWQLLSRLRHSPSGHCYYLPLRCAVTTLLALTSAAVGHVQVRLQCYRGQPFAAADDEEVAPVP